MSDIPDTRYARLGDEFIAYQTLGEGPPDLLFMRSATNHLELQWEEPRFVRFLRRLASMGRLIVFDTRGAGLSGSITLGGVPTPEEWADDALTVMDAVDSDRAVLIATGVATTRALPFAASHPERISSIVSIDGFARIFRSEDYEVGVDPEVLRQRFETTVSEWGVAASEFVEQDPLFAEWVPRYRRFSHSPSVAARLYGMGLSDRAALDVRHVLPAVRAPTLVIRHAGGRFPAVTGYLADHLPNAKLLDLPGHVLLEWRFDDPDAVADEIERFIGSTSRVRTDPDRVLATVLFTDIVDSTSSSANAGDRSWRETLDALDRMVDEEVARFRGRVVKSTGDGHLATFDGPGRAIKCGTTLRTRVASLGLTLRTGLHTGEVEVRGNDIGGIAVSIARRVCDAADDGCVFVSSAVPPLVAGSPIEFDDHGEQELKGVPGRWRLYAVRS